MPLKRGPLLMITAGLAFTGMVVGVKAARVEMGTFQLTALRSLVAVPLVAALCYRCGVTVRNWRLVLLRCLLGFGAVASFVTAAEGLSVAELAVLHKLQPIWVVLLAPLLLGRGERPDSRAWLGLGLGLAGALSILQPSWRSFDAPWTVSGLWALAGGCFSALAHLSLRRLGATERPRVVVFWFQLSLLPMALVGMGVAGEAATGTPRVGLWPSVFLVGIGAVSGQLLLTKAYQLGRAASTAVASTVSPIWAYLADWVIFDVLPTAATLLGGCLVVLSGLTVVLAGRGNKEEPPNGGSRVGVAV